MTASKTDRLILSMEAAGATCSVALGASHADRLDILASQKVDLRHGHAAVLVPMVAEVMGQAGVDLKALDAVAAGIGPGGFTGLRIALSTARGLGLALDRPVIGITSFQAAAANLSADVRRAHPGGILVMIDSRREEPYVASLDDDLMFRAKPCFMTMPDIAALIETAQPAIVTGDGLDLWPHDLKGVAMRIAAPADAESVLRLACDPAARYGQKAAPLYLREPDVSLPKAI